MQKTNKIKKDFHILKDYGPNAVIGTIYIPVSLSLTIKS